MIVSLRIDDRLLHGQVALVWARAFNTSRIVVANDAAATNDVISMTNLMAAPPGVKVLIKTVEGAIGLFHNERALATPIFVVVGNVADALRIVSECPGLVEEVNLANAGRFSTASQGTAVPIQLTPYVRLSIVELECLRELIRHGPPVISQVMPAKARYDAEQLLAQASLDAASDRAELSGP